jgi:hypothetical protein
MHAVPVIPGLASPSLRCAALREFDRAFPSYSPNESACCGSQVTATGPQNDYVKMTGIFRISGSYVKLLK